ncbi:LLM class flavin-dependent oxidoreductase [Arthrobacter sp. W4I7]|uniref:LLM class flavin-dependent oxidoreductase n=1 Tax=Arthrobacter sp. W4I7 TaxID=3042296 RepID=UPI002785C5C2|nr:LLM class flavin-dependent oxidoreductase [Arthrobacter sp. W4I7]MDQ0689458.1 FMN-dependent oxidoreductase (nitrilotriacetate monooxygenase family) [Arthrobacter sp. W4I7]
MGRQLKLNLFIYPGGHHEAAWRHPKSHTDRLLDIRFYQELAQRAEDAKLDAVFYADGPALENNVQYATRFRIEPFTWLSAIAVATERIGLIGTASTTYLEPYNAARLFASLDHLSNGRAGWNIVTTGAERAARNFGLDEHPPHAERYSRADEFVRVAGKLWDSWEDDAVVADADSGVFADTSRIHPIEHEGEYFRVEGALNTPRSPQGRPVFVQAGSSADGKAFAARHAEAVFTAHQTLESAQGFYADIKARAAANGRDPGQLLVLPGISPYLGSTEAEARALKQEFDELIQPEYGLGILRKLLGVDLDGVKLDESFPPELLAAAGRAGSRSQLLLGVIRRENPTVRQLLHRFAGARGHYVFAGTPVQVADEIQRWFEDGAADGFNIMPPWLPGGFEAFADEVVPILQSRGLFRTEYTGRTLREHFGLDRPESQYSADSNQPASQYNNQLLGVSA